MKKKILLLLILFMGLLVLSGCYDDAAVNTYSDPSFNKDTITKLAVFPIRNTRVNPGDARRINRSVTQGIHNQSPNIEIMSASEATQILNEHNLADDWATFLSNYQSSGIPNTKFLFKVGDVLNVDGIMQGEVLEATRIDGVYGERTARAEVTIRYSLLGTDSGKLLWEATSTGEKGTGTTIEDAPPIIEAILLAQEQIIKTLPF